MPIPPPPAVLFSITGKPISRAAATASPASDSSGLPGASGTPARRATSRATCFRPKVRICPGVGPMKRAPPASTRSANSAFSLKKPYPGWTASTPSAAISSSSLS